MKSPWKRMRDMLRSGLLMHAADKTEDVDPEARHDEVR